MSFGSFLFGQGQFAQGEQSANTGAALVPSQSLSLSQRQVTTTGVNNVNEGGSSGGRIDHKRLRFLGTEFSSRDRQRAERPAVSIGATAEVKGSRLQIVQRRVMVSASGTATATSNRVHVASSAPQGLGFRPMTVMVLNTRVAEDELNLRTQHLRADLSKRALPKLSDAEIREIMILVLAEESDRLRTAGKIDECHRCEERLALQLLEL